MDAGSREIRSRNLLFSIGAVFLVFLVFIPSLSFDFVLWDDTAIFEHPSIRDFSLNGFLNFVFESKLVRFTPGIRVFYFAMSFLFGPNPFAFHLIGVLLHSLVAGLFCWSMSLALPRAAAPIALVAAFLWATAPSRVEAVSWVSAQPFPLSAVLVFISGYLIVGGNATHKTGWGRDVFALCLYITAILISAAPASFPICLFLFFIGRGLGAKDAFRKTWPYCVVSVLTVFVHFRQVAKMHSDGFGMSIFALPFTRMAEEIVFSGRGIVMLLAPFWDGHALKPFYPTLLTRSDGLFSLCFLVGSLLAVLGFVAGYRGFRKIMGFVIVYFLVLVPFLGAEGWSAPRALDRYFYFPHLIVFFGLAAFTAYGLKSRRFKVTAFAFGLAFMAFSAQSCISQEEVWRNTGTLMSRLLERERDPSKRLHFLNRRLIWLVRGNGSLADLQSHLEGHSLEFPSSGLALAGWSILRFKQGRFRESLDFFTKTMESENDVVGSGTTNQLLFGLSSDFIARGWAAPLREALRTMKVAPGRQKLAMEITRVLDHESDASSGH